MITDRKVRSNRKVSSNSINKNTDSKTGYNKPEDNRVKKLISQRSLKAIKLCQMQIDALDRPLSTASNRPVLESPSNSYLENKNSLNDELAALKMLRTSNNSLICMHTQEALSRQLNKRYFSNKHQIKSWQERLN